MDELAVIGFVATMITIAVAIITPMLRLNSLLTTFTRNSETLRIGQEKQSQRLDVHSNRLDSLEDKVIRHDEKIEQLTYDHRHNHGRE